MKNPTVQKNMAPMGRTWCGPAALTVLTGKSYEECRQALVRATGRRNITGTMGGEMQRAIGLLIDGAMLIKVAHYDPSKIKQARETIAVREMPTFAAWLRQLRPPDAFYLVAAGQHWLTVRGRKVWDASVPDGAFLRSAPKRRARVTGVWRLKLPTQEERDSARGDRYLSVAHHLDQAARRAEALGDAALAQAITQLRKIATDKAAKLQLKLAG